MGAHSKPDISTDDRETPVTYDGRGGIGIGARVTITKPVRNVFAHFALAGSLVSFVIFSWYLVAVLVPAAVLGYMLSQTDVREGKYCSIAALLLVALLVVQHAGGAR